MKTQDLSRLGRATVATVVTASALLASLTGSAVANAAPTPRAYTTPAGGITVFVPAADGMYADGMYATGIANLGDNTGSVEVTDYTPAGAVLASYTVSVSCTTYFPGQVYYGGLITSGTFAGKYLFGRMTAGGPQTGTSDGQLQSSLTCYNGRNGSLAGPPYRVLQPRIVVQG